MQRGLYDLRIEKDPCRRRDTAIVKPDTGPPLPFDSPPYDDDDDGEVRRGSSSSDHEDMTHVVDPDEEEEER